MTLYYFITLNDVYFFTSNTLISYSPYDDNNALSAIVDTAVAVAEAADKKVVPVDFPLHCATHRLIQLLANGISSSEEQEFVREVLLSRNNMM